MTSPSRTRSAAPVCAVEANDSLDEALTRIVDRWRGPLVGMLRGWRVADPVEVAQDALAELWLGRARFRGRWDDEGAVGAWLRGIAWNLARSSRRSAARGPAGLDEADDRPHAGADASETVDQTERADRIRAAVDALPEDQRTVVLMCALEGTPSKRVAALLGITERAVEGRLYRARQALTETLGRSPERNPAVAQS